MKKNNLFKSPKLCAFLGIMSFLIFHFNWGYFGHYGYDDVLGYAFYAQKWSDGALFFLDEDLFSYRWGFVALTAISYTLFGISDAASALAPTLILLSTVLVVFKNLKGFTPIIAVIGALLFCLDNWTIYYSDKLMPDSSVALACFSAFTIIQTYQFQNQPQNPILYGTLLSCVLFWGFLCKISILLLAPVFLLLCLKDLFNQKNRIFWSAVIFTSILLGTSYLLFIYHLTGNPLSRFLATEAGLESTLGNSFAFCNYAQLPLSSLLYRIFGQLIVLFGSTGMGFVLVLALPMVLSQRIKAILNPTNPESYWSFILLASLISSNFMTTSIKSYLPICPDVRHFLFLVPIAAVLAAPAVYQFAQSRKRFQLFLIASFCLALFALIGNWGNMKWLYLGLFLLISVRTLLKDHSTIKNSFLFLLLLGALSPVFSSMLTARKSGYLDRRAIIYQHFINKPHKSIVLCNEIQRNIGRYYFGFNKEASTQFYSFEEINLIPADFEGKLYLLVEDKKPKIAAKSIEKMPPAFKEILGGNLLNKQQLIVEKPRAILYLLPNHLIDK